ncbi:MAG: hypothetical protein ABIO57_01670 [Candidatus Paceibacterota bacterium]
MKISKLILPIFAITTLTSSSITFVSAESNNITAQQTAAVQLDAKTILTPVVNVNATTSANTKAQNDRAKTASQASEDRKDDDHSSMGDSHRSIVATFVQNLLEVSDRERSIGAQVKVIAQAQNDSEKETTDAIVKIENRSSFKTFFLGSDYKNIGTLRSKMTTTANQLAELNKLAEKAVTSADKAEIKAEIQAMEQEQVKIDAFISAHENTFSLFGWMSKGKTE